MPKKNILQEAIAESKQIKEAAVKNAEAVLMEQFKDSIRETVEAQLNEGQASDIRDPDCSDDQEEKMYEAKDEVCDDEEESEVTEEQITYEVSEEPEEDEGLELDALDDDEDDEEVTDEGLTEADIDAALAEALSDESLTEVAHGKLGEPQEVTPEKHDTGLMDEDGTEAGWEEKSSKAAKQWGVKEHSYKSKIAKLVKENLLYKKANRTLKTSLKEVKLFNAQLFFANKLMNKYPGIATEHKKDIVSKIEGAKTFSEAKMVFESLDMAFGTISEKATSKSKKSSPLTEALGFNKKGKETGKGVSKVDDRHLNEGSNQKSRLQELAGIIKG
jgi:hypothetical protein